jgi:uncharacterized protein with gpF-like domain
MTQLNEEHFEVIEKNKIERYERQKLIEDRMKVMEKAIESHAKILARFQMTENNVNPYSEEDFETDLTPDEKEITHEQ